MENGFGASYKKKGPPLARNSSKFNLFLILFGIPQLLPKVVKKSRNQPNQVELIYVVKLTSRRIYCAQWRSGDCSLRLLD